MSDNQLDALKTDFLSWTGGFGPEDSNQITTYVSTSMPFDLSEHEATVALLDWMKVTADRSAT
jgi:hypothetical protein